MPGKVSWTLYLRDPTSTPRIAGWLGTALWFVLFDCFISRESTVHLVMPWRSSQLRQVQKDTDSSWFVCAVVSRFEHILGGNPGELQFWWSILLIWQVSLAHLLDLLNSCHIQTYICNYLILYILILFVYLVSRHFSWSLSSQSQCSQPSSRLQSWAECIRTLPGSDSLARIARCDAPLSLGLKFKMRLPDRLPGYLRHFRPWRNLKKWEDPQWH